jgi:hypothetical protein
MIETLQDSGIIAADFRMTAEEKIGHQIHSRAANPHSSMAHRVGILAGLGKKPREDNRDTQSLCVFPC